MTDKKRILLLTRPICPPWDEASKNFAYTLAKSIKDAEIHILTCGFLADIADSADNVVQHPIYSSPKWDLGQKVRAYKFLVKEFFLKGGKGYDILHSFFTPTKLNVFTLKLCLRNKNLKTIQTLATLRDDLYGEEKLKKIIHADLIITYSDYAKEKLEQMGFQNVRRIYPGIDLADYSLHEKNQELMKRYNIKQDDFVINFTGEYVRLNAIDDVVDSFIDLQKEHKNFHLQLACRLKNQADAKKKEEIIAKLKSAGCFEKASLLDDQSYKMSDIYNLSDISIFPVRDMKGKFDIPLAVIEAMACGKPVIASNIERLKYFLNDDNSILINPGDRAALKEKILYLYDNSEARGILGGKGMKFARENFDIMKIVEEYEEVYRNM